MDCSGYESEQLHTKVTSLCNRIEQIQCYNAKDRLPGPGRLSPPLPSCLLTACLCDYYSPASPLRLVLTLLFSPDMAKRSQPAAGGYLSLQHASDTTSSDSTLQTLSESLCACWLPRWPAPHARGLRLGGAAQPHTVLPAGTDCREPVSPGPLPTTLTCLFTLTTECSCIELIALFAVFAWLWNLPPFLLPKQQPPVVQGFLNTKRSIRALEPPKRSQVSFYHPQEPFFFFFFSFLEMVNKAPKPWQNSPKNQGMLFLLSHSESCDSQCQPLPCSYSCPFILRLFRRSGAGARQMLT